MLEFRAQGDGQAPRRQARPGINGGPDARAIAEDLTQRKVRLSLGASVYDPTDPVGRLLFNVLAMVAEFEADLIRSRTREGMRVAKAKGHLRGKQPKLNPRQEAHLIELLRTGEYTTAELGDLFGVARSTVYRAVARSKASTAAGRTTATTTAPAPHAGSRPIIGNGGLATATSTYRPRHGAPASFIREPGALPYPNHAPGQPAPNGTLSSSRSTAHIICRSPDVMRR